MIVFGWKAHPRRGGRHGWGWGELGYAEPYAPLSKSPYKPLLRGMGSPPHEVV